MSTDHDRLPLAHALGAREVIRPHLSPTPLRQYPSLDHCIGARVYIKHENHNPTGTFKIRGGINLMHHLAGQGISGVTTYSTGNHGSSVTASARMFGLTATVVVPEGSNPLKIQAIKDAGAELIEYGKDFEEAGQKVAQLVEERGLYFVLLANEPHLINGVATEFIEIIAVQAEASQAAYLSWKVGKIVTAPNTTFAGGVATGTAYDIPFSLYKNALAEFVLLTEAELYEGIALAAHHTRNLTEGAGSACLRAAFKIRNRLSGKKVALQMSGGNASGVELQTAIALPCLLDGVC